MPATALAAPAPSQPLSVVEALQKAADQLKKQNNIISMRMQVFTPIDGDRTDRFYEIPEYVQAAQAYAILHPLYEEATKLAALTEEKYAASQPFSPEEALRVRAFGERMQRTFGWLDDGLKEAVTRHKHPMFGKGHTILKLLGDYVTRSGDEMNHLAADEFFIRGNKAFKCNPVFAGDSTPDTPSFLALCDYKYLSAALDPKHHARATIRAKAEDASGQLKDVLQQTRETLASQVLQLRSTLGANPHAPHRDAGSKLEEKINRLHGGIIDFIGESKQLPFEKWDARTKRKLFDFADKMELFFHRSNDARAISSYQSGNWLQERVRSSIVSNPFFGAQRPVSAQDFNADVDQTHVYEINPLLLATDSNNSQSFFQRCDYSRFFDTVSALKHAEIIASKGRVGRA